MVAAGPPTGADACASRRGVHGGLNKSSRKAQGWSKHAPCITAIVGLHAVMCIVPMSPAPSRPCLAMQTIERAHTPKNLWQKIRLKRQYAQVRGPAEAGPGYCGLLAVVVAAPGMMMPCVLLAAFSPPGH